MELADEEKIETQRFDVVIIWSDSGERLTEERIRNVLMEEAQGIDPEATVNVEEIVEPTY
jgi:hypothetical protein